MKVRLTFTEPLLGTRSGNKELATEYQIAKHPDVKLVKDETSKTVEMENTEAVQDEIETVGEMIEKASTLFDRDENGVPFRWDYQFKGFFKEAALAMIETDTIKKEDLRKLRLTLYTYKRTIGTQIFVKPRKILLMSPTEPISCERPLRGQTMRGERIALAKSEELPIGTTCEFQVICLNKKLEPFVAQWLTYGELFGCGQWRSSGKGRFTWEQLA